MRARAQFPEHSGSRCTFTALPRVSEYTARLPGRVISSRASWSCLGAPGLVFHGGMCPPGWQLGCGSSPGFSLTPPNLDWAGKSPPVPPEPLHLLYPVFCPSPSGTVRFSCVAAARGAQDSHARSCGTQPGPDAIQAVCPPLCVPDSRSLAFSLAGISLRSATPWQAPAEVTGAAGCRNPADPGRARIPPNPTRTGRTVPHEAPRDRQELGPHGQEQPRGSHRKTKLLSLSLSLALLETLWRSIVAGKESEITPGGAAPGFGGARRCCPAPSALTWDL